ncbi:MAG: PQQ-dependent sugar dehydrogenase [Planctomyces sp.]|nr:PQQ-dependent sugar dehydrogenase [Planctomyces sp.]
MCLIRLLRTSALTTAVIAAVLIPTAFLADAAEKQRVPWTTSRVTGYPDPPLPWRAVKIYDQLKVSQPVYIRAEPGTNRMLIVEHKGDWPEPGGIRVFEDRPDVGLSKPLLQYDRLIYGFCFHPNYEANGHLFVISNGPMDKDNKQNRISRFTVARTAEGDIVPDSELVVLEWDSNGHNGGDLAFGPDGFLYCPTGDGTSDSDTLETGQGLNDLLAVMIRIDVDHPDTDRPYSIPPDNPFVNTPGARPEIWAYGFRNPWRMDYDHQSNQLWVGQNGQDLWEQVYLIRKGENYGWSVQEGSHPFYLERPKGAEPIVAPAAEHHHSESRSLTGGIVYRKDLHPELQGFFIYGDYSTGKIWGIRHDGTKTTEHLELADTTLQIAGFGTNHAGDLLIADHGGGLYRLEKTPQVTPPPFPVKLSETGLFVSVPEHKMAQGVVPYEVNSQLWSDGAHKKRWIAVPGEEKIDYTSTRGWNFPNGSVLVKSFAIDMHAGNPESRKWIETRLLVRQDNEWTGYSYRWNEDQSDAVLLGREPLDAEYLIGDASQANGTTSQNWHFPGRAECMVCHSRAANYVLGTCEVQMNRDYQYDEGPQNQIEWLAERGYFTKSPEKPADQLERLVDPFDETQPLESRARSYLHANCSNCHIEAGGGNSAFSIEFNTKPEQARLIDATPVHQRFAIEDAKVVASGSPARSILYHRINRRGPGQMPPLGSNQPDVAGVDLIGHWIRQLPAPTSP